MEIQIFNFEGKEVRTVQIEGEPWFVGKDVCSAFGDKNHNRSISRLDDDDKKVTNLLTGGGKQNIIVINESGLYALLFHMQPQKTNNEGVQDAYPLEVQERIEQLRKFKRWVTGDVLPSIRKHGAYMTPSTIETLVNNPDLIIELASRLKDEQQNHKATQQRLEDKTTQLDENKQWYTVKRVAKLNGINWRDINWKRLKTTSQYMQCEIKKVFDANYGNVNTYHIDVWEQEYPELNYQ